MRIIIAGAGDVGYHLAKLLAYEEQDIVIIDKDQECLNHAASNLDVVTIKGSSTSYKTLQEADISKADLLISVTSSEETNLTTAIIGKHLGAKKTVARIQNEEYLFDKEKIDLQALGIDELISPESLAAREIKRLLKDRAITDNFDFDQGKLSLIGLNIEEDSKICGKTVQEASRLNGEQNYINVAILRDSETIIPHGNTEFKAGDHAYFISCPDGIESILKVVQKKEVEKKIIKKVMILGGSKVGVFAAKRLGKKYSVKLIEKDKDKCFQLADELPDVLVINGDVRNIALLESEGIENMDAFIAVTGNSETNIMSSLVAKKYNVEKTIALVENIDYIHLSQNIGVDTMINKKLIAANFIFRYIRKGDIISLTSIHGVDAEVLEFIVNKNSKIIMKPIKELGFPSSAIIGGAVRDGKGVTTTGDFQFKANDRAVVLCQPDCIHKVESFFN